MKKATNSSRQLSSEQKLKIAIFTDAFFPQTNGVVTSIINLSNGLADIVHKVLIIAPKLKSNKKFTFKHKNIEIIRILSIPTFIYKDVNFSIPSSLLLLNKIQKFNPDVIHFETPLSIGYDAIILSKILSKPLIGTFHTFFADPQYLKHLRLNNKFIQKIAWTFNNVFYNSADLVTAPSETTKQELIEHNCIKPIKVISNGIDFNIFKTKKTIDFRKEYNIPSYSKVLLYIGRIAYEKNLFFLIDIFEKIVKEKSDVLLLMVGDGPQLKELKQYVSKKHLKNKVIFTGSIEHKKLVGSSVFTTVDLFITTSTTENQPMTILESQANGLVCVGANRRGLKTLIEDNINGFLVEPNDINGFKDKIIFLLDNPKSLLRMKKNTLKMIKKHDVKNVIIEWEKTYIKLKTKYRIKPTKKTKFLNVVRKTKK